MDINHALGGWWQRLPNPNQTDPTYRARQARQQRKDFPEIVYMVIKEVKRGQKFKLETPWGSMVDDVPCIDPSIGKYLREGMTVGVRYSKVDPNACYIRNLGPVGIEGPA